MAMRWDDVTARASARKNSSHERTINGRIVARRAPFASEHRIRMRPYSACLVIFSSTPIQPSVMKRDEPP